MSDGLNMQHGPDMAVPPQVKKLGWPVWVLLVLVLAVLAAWGSRERTWKKTTDEYSKSLIKISEEKILAESRATQLALQVKKGETSKRSAHIVEHADGSKETTETEEVASYEEVEQEVRQEYTARLQDVTAKLVDAEAKLQSKEEGSVKSAPFWNVVGAWEPMAGSYYLGGGVNLGPLSVSLDNPVALVLRPRVGAMLRF